MRRRRQLVVGHGLPVRWRRALRHRHPGGASHRTRDGRRVPPGAERRAGVRPHRRPHHRPGRLRRHRRGVRRAHGLAFPASGGNLGPVQLDFGVVAPRHVGLVLTTEAARGGGYVAVDPDIGRYAGALSFDFVSIGIDAIVVVDTDVGAVAPGADGWALFASLAASFPGMPLGFGFTLSGVGGLLALNRTIDTEALATGLRAGVVDDLLFPDDPIGGAADLIARIDEYFPLMSGNTVVGPVVEIGWGTPTLITAQLGVVLSLPDGVIAVLGSVEALLPDPAAPLIRLRMDSIGAVDLAAGTMSLDGVALRLEAARDRSTSAATWRCTSDGRAAVLPAVGRRLPSGFEPPSIVPAAMHDLRTMRAALDLASNVAISIESYFAVTSNSLQFGAAVHVIASVEIWPATYTAKGWLTFDVLLVFSPFKIVADDVGRGGDLLRRSRTDGRPAQPSPRGPTAVVRGRHRSVHVLRPQGAFRARGRGDRGGRAAADRAPTRRRDGGARVAGGVVGDRTPRRVRRRHHVQHRRGARSTTRRCGSAPITS